MPYCAQPVANYELSRTSKEEIEEIKLKMFVVVPISENEKCYHHDLAKSFRQYFILGRIQGILPLIGITAGKVEELKFKWRSIGTFVNFTMSCILVLNVFAGGIGYFNTYASSTHQMAQNLHYLIFFTHGACVYLFFLWNAKRFIEILNYWKSVTMHYTFKDKHLRRDTWLLAVLVYFSAIFENTFWHVKHYEKFYSTTSNNETFGEYFYRNSEPQFATVFPYHPVTLAFLLISNKIALYAGQFGDITLIILSRALYFKFKHLIRMASEDLIKPGSEKDATAWKHLIQDFLTLLDLLITLEEFLSPLVFVSFSANIFNLCLHLNRTLLADENLTLIASIYANSSFFYIIFRFYMVCLTASKINEHALNIHAILRKCPQENYTPEVAKFQNQLHNMEIGLRGLGSFTITKPFMLKILSVIFTIEIVLMQSAISSSSHQSP